MAKKPRVKGVKLYHHIYNRGNDRHPTFKKPADYKRYLKYLFDYSKRYKIDVLAYALMEWHLHLFLFDRLEKISQFINVLHGRYAQIFNKVYGRVGHVFESRFKNKVIDANNYGLWLSRYIHRQPVEAGLVSSPEDYEWTSYRVYIGKRKDSLLKTDIILSQFGDKKVDCHTAYREFVERENEGPIDWKAVESSSQPFVGDEEFVKELSLKLVNVGSIEDVIIKNPLDVVSFCLKVPIDVLKYPKDKVQKRLRRQAIIILDKEYDFGVREIARIFSMSPSSVSDILKPNNRTPAPITYVIHKYS